MELTPLGQRLRQREPLHAGCLAPHEHDLHLSVSRSDALRRLLTLALEDAEDTAEAEAILRAHEPRVSWEALKADTSALEPPPAP